MENTAKFKRPLWLTLFSWLFLFTLALAPFLVLLSMFSSLDNLNVGILGISLEGPRFGAFPKLVLLTVFLFGGYVGYLILTGTRSAFRVGLFYCGYAVVLSALFHLWGIGTDREAYFETFLHYSLLVFFAGYLRLKRGGWESALIRE
ncbi:MAG: hypothetical protein ACSHYB_16280 [Roseibacillus sp.]